MTNHNLETQIATLETQAATDRTELARLRQLVSEKAGAGFLAQKYFAESLQDKNQLNETLAAAVQELNTRLRMLLTSRLLHVGWKIGLGKTPYWNDPAADELSALIELTRVSVDGSQQRIRERLKVALGFAGAGSNGEMQAALAHLHEKGFRPTVILDIGAAQGAWTVCAAHCWHGAEFFMIDPLMQSEPALQLLCKDPRFHYLRLAVGDEPGEMAIDVPPDPDGTSLLLTDPSSAAHQIINVRTIDQLLGADAIKPPQLVKIDVQGYELKVLRGAKKLFEHTEVFIVETNLFEFMPGCPRLHEMIAFMAERNFYPFDFAGQLRRPFENDLGQVDVVFVSRRSPMMASNLWLSEPPVQSRHPLPPPLGSGLVISVIICTNNPRPDIFQRTLDALDGQTLEKNRFEVIVVDNASRLELELWQLQEGRSLPIKLIREARPGLSRARCTGISHGIGELLMFVDDDNFLAPDYLERALEIARLESRIGLFGGICEAELESPIPAWQYVVLPHLGIRNHGDRPITKFADHWGNWEPIGAGMVARRSVAERCVRMFQEIPDARILGRAGSTLLSGEDTLFARAAYREGYACSYQPLLRLTHFIKSSRLTWNYMSRVVEGHGRSFVILQRALGKRVAPLKIQTAIARLLYRLKSTGRAGLITGRWEVGYAKECQSPSKEPTVDIQPTVSLAQATLPVSVVLCTRNPRTDLLRRTLDSLQNQTASHASFEIIIVDNGSSPPIQLTDVTAGGAGNISVAREERIGHVFARSAGICAARGGLILFVDDDNFLASDYLTNAICIADEAPTIGTFGGIAEPEFETIPPAWKLQLLKYLAVRDHGPTPITSTKNDWGEWEPIGAGMVVRRDVAERFVNWVRNVPGADQLGRSERHLMSGDDALFSRAAHHMGYSSSYQPALRLTHYLKQERFQSRYLTRLLSGHGRTYVLLNLIMETPVPDVSFWRTLTVISFRLRREGAIGLLHWFWDLGRYLESRQRRIDPRSSLRRSDAGITRGSDSC